MAFSSSFCNLESDVCSFTALPLRFGVAGTATFALPPPVAGIVAFVVAGIDVGCGCFASASAVGSVDKLKLGIVKVTSTSGSIGCSIVEFLLKIALALVSMFLILAKC